MRNLRCGRSSDQREDQSENRRSRRRLPSAGQIERAHSATNCNSLEYFARSVNAIKNRAAAGMPEAHASIMTAAMAGLFCAFPMRAHFSGQRAIPIYVLENAFRLIPIFPPLGTPESLYRRHEPKLRLSLGLIGATYAPQGSSLWLFSGNPRYRCGELISV
jgi:hypothetical protein